MSKIRPENGNGNNTKNKIESNPKLDTLNLIELKKKDINSLKLLFYSKHLQPGLDDFFS